MNNTFSLEQISTTGKLDANLKLRPCKLDLMSLLMELKSINPKLGQNQRAEETGASVSTLQRYRHDIKMQSHFKSKSPKRTQKTSKDLTRKFWPYKSRSPRERI